MSCEWKPGDVVTATVNGRPNVRLVAGWSRYEPRLRWCEMSPRRGDGDDDECWFIPSQVTNARPLVVIDPEDREQVKRIFWEQEEGVKAIRKANPDQVGVSLIDALQVGLRRMVDPERTVKPEEPTGLGAVVEDAEGKRWVRFAATEADGRNWASGCADFNRNWPEIDAVHILSEGVQP